jgi:hypothetical protein
MAEQFNAEELELIKYLKTEGYFEFRKVANFGICGLQKFVFTTGIVIGLTHIGYYGRYCYPSQSEASQELINWDGQGDPKGNWLKYKGEGGERENEGCKMCKANQ